MHESSARQQATARICDGGVHGSFTLAAKELYLSQSAVSHSMKALEQDVGSPFGQAGQKGFAHPGGRTIAPLCAKDPGGDERSAGVASAARQMGPRPAARRREHNGVPVHPARRAGPV